MMKIGELYRFKLDTIVITLWTGHGGTKNDTLRSCGRLDSDSVFQLVDIKSSLYDKDSVFLKVIAGTQMGWFGCDRRTAEEEPLWSKYFEELHEPPSTDEEEK